MFFEAIGKRVSRLPIFFLLPLAPLAIILSILFLEALKMKELERNFSVAIQKGKKTIFLNQTKANFLERYRGKDPYFLQKKLETLPLLSSQTEFLEGWRACSALASFEEIDKKRNFLASNQLVFVEGELRNSATVKETQEKLQQKIWEDQEDLKRILSWIESKSIDTFTPDPSSPQFVIETFKLHKKPTALGIDLLEMDMSLIKREFF